MSRRRCAPGGHREQVHLGASKHHVEIPIDGLMRHVHAGRRRGQRRRLKAAPTTEALRSQG